MRNTMLDLMRAYAAIVLSDEATADELFDRAAAMDGYCPDGGRIHRSVARQHRVRAIAMRAKGAALRARYDRLCQHSSGRP